MTTSSGFTPTTTVSILRTDPDDPNAVDEYGDPLDTDTPIATGLPASIIQQAVRQFLPSENRLTIIQTHTGRLRGDVDVKPTDRIRDERTGTLYTIEGLVQPQAPFGARAAIRLDLRKIT
ncbi:head-tail adaptor protein [Actinomadura miaoliensis]|uniref:Head-tail adaptor protein n=1 Tax=Actinomadura miaoliensis TaxID=430685 RepID=A0ABP7W728_9ACTN